MKQFLKFVLATIVGIILIWAVLFFIVFALAAGAKSSAEQPHYIESNSVLLASFEKPILDRGVNNELNIDLSGFGQPMGIGLNDILDNLEKAKVDDNIDGVFLDLTAMSAGMGQLEEIRAKLVDFKTSKKWIIAYSDSYTQASYFLASTADEVYMQPVGNLNFSGLRSELMFFKNMFEKLDIDIQFIRGSNNKFKSFGESFVEEAMSAANREQQERMLGSMWDSYLEQVSDARNISKKELNLIADSLLVRNAKDALRVGLVDGLKYRDEVLDILRGKTETAAHEEIEFARLNNYTRTPVSAISEASGSDRIAIVYAEGNIVDGKGEQGSIGGSSLSETIREAREDEDVKAVVLRVNSPGGSALASDVIWREVIKTKEVKPVVVSMGNVAASGGYYISCAADKIFADATTITGSIGVFGMIPNMQGFFNNKLGVTFDGAKTNTYADMMTISRALSADEKAIIQGYIDNIYGDFKQKVADGRGMTVAQVDAIGQGRVWTGVDAKANGLIDEIGGLEAAIEEANKLAKLENAKEIELPKQKDVLEQMIEDMTGQAVQTLDAHIYGKDEKMQRIFKEIEFVKSMKGMQARMPFDITIY